MSALSDMTGADTGEPAGTSGVLRVVIIDDTPDIRCLVRMILHREGCFEVIGEAGDGAEGIQVVAHHRPDVVLLDLSMPEMDGLEALPQIRAAAPESTIVVLSGFNSREMSAESMHRGASSYLEKADIAGRLVPHILGLVAGRPRPRALAGGRPSQVVPAARAGLPAAPPVHDAGEEMIAGLTHELLNPVTILQGFAAILQNGVESMSPETIQQSADAISRATGHLVALIRAFSDLRKIEIDSLDLAFEATDIAQLVRETVTDMIEVTGTHPVAVEVPTATIARIDPVRIRQVLINLLANAAKFSPAGTRIDVTVTSDDRTTEISVRDHGPGIPADKLFELFQKFARLGSTVPGTGIGLYLSRGIARAHGGDLILAESHAPGCRFTVQLPLLRAAGSDGASDSSDTRPATMTARIPAARGAPVRN